MRNRSRAALLVLFAAALLVAAPARAGENPALGLPAAGRLEAAGRVDGFHGGYTERVAIAVPPFHGVEPALALSYVSSAGSGTAGVGWALGGASTIERASPGRGVPAWSSSDVFLLDGVELVPWAGTPRQETVERVDPKSGAKVTLTEVTNDPGGTCGAAEPTSPTGHDAARMLHGAFNEKTGCYNYFVGQVQSKIHDAFIDWVRDTLANHVDGGLRGGGIGALLFAGNGAKAFFTMTNVTTALIFQAAAAGAALAALGIMQPGAAQTTVGQMYSSAQYFDMKYEYARSLPSPDRRSWQ
jgi:hypothetical protein